MSEERDDKAIQEVKQRLQAHFASLECDSSQETRYEGMTYEQGVLDAIRWFKGRQQDHWPFTQEEKIKRKKRVLPPGVVPR
jgi:hypothetical protein